MRIGGIEIRSTNIFVRRAAVVRPWTCTCERCGLALQIDPAECLAAGWRWPICCTQQMTLGVLRLKKSALRPRDSGIDWNAMANEIRNEFGSRLWKEGVL